MSVTRTKTHAGAAVVSALLLLGAVGACGKTETSASLVADARQFIQKGDSKAAVIQLKNALVKNPSDTDARLTLGLLYLDTGDAVSADKELRKALELGVPKDKVVPALASALMQQQQYQKVLDLSADTGSDADMLALRAEANAGLGRADQARDLYAQALALKPGHVAALIGSARQALARKDLEQANRLTEQAVASNPTDASAWMFKGDMLRAQAKAGPALAAYDQVLKLKPNHRSAHVERAFVEIAEGKFDTAKADLEAARKITPNALMVAYAQALLDFTQGKHAAAKDALQKNPARGARPHAERADGRRGRTCARLHAASRTAPAQIPGRHARAPLRAQADGEHPAENGPDHRSADPAHADARVRQG